MSYIYSWRYRPDSVSMISGSSATGYKNKYVVDSFAYNYYALKHMEVTECIDRENVISGVLHALVDIYGDRYRLAEAVAIANDFAGLIYNEFYYLFNGDTSSLKSVSGSQYDEFVKWLNECASIDVEETKKKYSIQKVEPYVYPED